MEGACGGAAGAAGAGGAGAAARLEWELSLPTEQVVSHGWYHGALARVAAEALLQQDRSFLVRDSSSQPGNYVLSCRSNAQHLHFVIQRIVVNPDTVYERCQYQFEDEAYGSVADLVTSYVGSGKPVSAASGARIQYPANRRAPLTAPPAAEPPARPAQLRPTFRKQRSHSLTPADLAAHAPSAKSASADGVIQAQGDGKLGKSSEGGAGGAWDGAAPTSPPAKPARHDAARPDERRLELQRLHTVSGSDSGNGSGDSAQSSAADPRRDDAPLATPSAKQQFDYDLVEARLLQADCYDYTVPSRIHLDSFESPLLGAGLTKPLESDTLHTIKLLLRTAGPRILANHLTRVDLDFLLEETVQIEGLDKQASVLELCFLPQGRQLRMDIIERVETFRLLVAVTVLTGATDRARADALNDWIQLAVETKTALGNLYGFTAIMAGLCMPQVECLDNAWNVVRRVYTDNAFMFEAKLRPSLKSMNEGSHPPPPNTTVPHLLPPVLCFHTFDGEGGLLQSEESFPGSLYLSSELELFAAAAQLAAARRLPDHIDTYKRNAKTVVQEMSSLGPGLDPALLDLFRPEFHARFLWGARGAATAAPQRLARLTDVVTSMAAKLASQPRDADT